MVATTKGLNLLLLFVILIFSFILINNPFIAQLIKNSKGHDQNGIINANINRLEALRR